MTERVRCLKIESVAEGGLADDSGNGVTECAIGQDYLDCAGVTYQRAGANTNTADALVRCERTTAGALHFADTVANGSAGLDLSQLLTSASGSVGAFNALQDIRLWVGGPGDGFASGAVRTVNCTGLLPISITWSTSSAQGATKLCQSVITYSGMLPAKVVTTLYSATGTLLRTLTDIYTYTTLAYPQTTRTWS